MSKKVMDIINDVLNDLETYKSNVKKFKGQISSGDEQTIHLVISTAEYCLTNSSVKPIALLNALRLLKESLDTKNQQIIKMLSINKTILEKMFELSKYDHTNQNDDRGSLYFGENADQQLQIIGNSLIRLSLECFLFWSYLYQTDIDDANAPSSYLCYYEQLVELGVKFPEKINYFKQALKEMQQAPQQQQESSSQQMDSQHQYSEASQNQVDLSQEIDDTINQFNNTLLQIEMAISNEKNDQSIDKQGLDKQFGVVDRFIERTLEFNRLIDGQQNNLELKYKQYIGNLCGKAAAVQKCYRQYKQNKTTFIKMRNAFLEATNKELLQIILEEEEQESSKHSSNKQPSNIFYPQNASHSQAQHNLEVEELDDIDYGDNKTKLKSNNISSGFTVEDQYSSNSISNQNNNNREGSKKNKTTKDDSPRLFYYSGEKQNNRNQASEERKSSTRYEDNRDDEDFLKGEDLKDVSKQIFAPSSKDNIATSNKSNTIINAQNVRDSFGNYANQTQPPPSQNQFNKDTNNQPKFGVSQSSLSNNSSRTQINNNNNNNMSNYSSNNNNNTPAFRIENNSQQSEKNTLRDNTEEILNLQRNVEEKQMEIQRLLNQLNGKEKEKELVEKEVKINKDEKEMHKRESEKQKMNVEKLESQINVLTREKQLIIDEKEIVQQKLDQAQNKITQLTDKTIKNSQQMTDYQIVVSENSQLRQELNQQRNFHQELVDTHDKRESEMMQRIRESEKEKAQKENESEKEKLKLNERINALQKQINELEESNRMIEESMEHTKKMSLVVDEQKHSESKKTKSLAQELYNKKQLIEKYEADNDRLTKQIVLMKDEMKRQNDYLSELESQVNNLQLEREKQNNKIESLLEQLSTERNKVVNQQQIDYQQAIINEDQKFQNERVELNLRIEKKELENLKQAKDLISKQQHIEQLNSNISRLTNLIHDLKEQSNQSNTQLEQQAIKINELNHQTQQKSFRSASSVDVSKQISQEELNILKSQIQELQNERNALKRDIEESRNSKFTYRSANNSSTGEVKVQHTEIEGKLSYQQQQIDHLNHIIQQLQQDNLRPKTKRDHLEIQTENQISHNFDQTLKSTSYSNYTAQDIGRLDSKATPTSKPPIYVRDSISEDQSVQQLGGYLLKNQLNITQNLNPMMLKLSNITTNSSEQINQLQLMSQQHNLMQELFSSQGMLSKTNPIPTQFDNSKQDSYINKQQQQHQTNKILHSEPSSKSPQSRQYSMDQILAQHQLPQSVKNVRCLNTIEEEQSNTFRKRPTIRSKSSMNNYSNTSNMLNLSDYLRSKTPQQSGHSSTSNSHYISTQMNLFNLNNISHTNANNNNNNNNNNNLNGHSRSRNNSRCDSRVSSDFLNLSERRDSQDKTLYLDIENADYHLSTNNNTSFNVNHQQSNSLNMVVPNNRNLNYSNNNFNQNNNANKNTAINFGQRSHSQQSSKNNLQSINNHKGLMLTLQGNSSSFNNNSNKNQISNFYDTENFATSATNQLSSSITPSERMKCDFFFQQLIYPYQKPDDYYNNKQKQNNVKGQLIQFNNGFVQSYFNQYQKVSSMNLQDQESQFDSSFDRFRKACLLEKGVVTQNSVIKVGTLSSLHFSQTKKHFLKITLHFLNISKIDIPSLSYVNLENSDVTVKMNPNIVRCDIPSEHKIKVDLLFQINKNPFSLPEGSILLRQNGQDHQIQIVLPATLNKFMCYKEINVQQYKQRWQYIQSKNIFKSAEFEYSQKMLKNSFSIKKYLPELIELTPFEKDEHVAGISDFKVGGVVSFIQKESSEYLIKLIFKPLQRMQIQFGICSENNQNSIDETDTHMAHYFINTIYFLFKSF